MTDYIDTDYPAIAAKLPKLDIASLPTPVSHHVIGTSTVNHDVFVKQDDLTSPLYGGNKVRKLEYLLRRAMDRGATRVATFGAAGSNHALATSMFAHELGLDCTCFLAGQKATPNIVPTLNQHLQLGTELVRYGRGIDHLQLFRRYIQNRKTWVIPLGGTCWLGAVGFVNAGLELAAQIAAGVLETPHRIYLANGTMGSVAGLAIGLALAGHDTEIHAVRVADSSMNHPKVLHKLIAKTLRLLRRMDPSIPDSTDPHKNIRWRDDFYAGGYAVFDDATCRAVDRAKKEMGLTLETTYTGKAMTALLHDIQTGDDVGPVLFWNTYNSRPLSVGSSMPTDLSAIPESFHSYYR
ncbi:MAG: pyridoxal-phosphate dependent enzyme [Gammaproteobacteria bacterium]|nr:pyridoxal-phosphate dependent enzyme [Gammaproteobacteria bacterium]